MLTVSPGQSFACHTFVFLSASVYHVLQIKMSQSLWEWQHARMTLHRYQRVIFAKAQTILQGAVEISIHKMTGTQRRRVRWWLGPVCSLYADKSIPQTTLFDTIYWNLVWKPTEADDLFEQPPATQIHGIIKGGSSTLFAIWKPSSTESMSRLYPTRRKQPNISERVPECCVSRIWY